jgi:uncharacterized lipoprotein YmbA
MTDGRDVMRTLRGIVPVILVLCLTACGSSPPTSYYTLDPVYSGPTLADMGDLRIGVGPFIFPDLLDRPQIVLRGTGNEVIVSEFDRWADDLDGRFQAIVARNLVIATGTDHVYEHPWRDNFDVDYRILGIVDQFSADSGGTVRLRIRWVVQDSSGKDTLATHEGVYNESTDPDDFGSIAAAMSRAAASSAADMARILGDVATRKPSSN